MIVNTGRLDPSRKAASRSAQPSRNGTPNQPVRRLSAAGRRDGKPAQSIPHTHGAPGGGPTGNTMDPGGSGSGSGGYSGSGSSGSGRFLGLGLVRARAATRARARAAIPASAMAAGHVPSGVYGLRRRPGHRRVLPRSPTGHLPVAGPEHRHRPPVQLGPGRSHARRPVPVHHARRRATRRRSPRSTPRSASPA